MSEHAWWQRAVFYQIYPRSFADGNGDGVGDFRGMIDHLDYLADLGVDGVWLSPFYPSPLVDHGYDVADYVSVAPEYGSLADFVQFLDGAHERGIRVIIDLVLNHTSNRHPWFLESRSGPNHPKRDWYIWGRGTRGGPPNRWCSWFGGSAWEQDGSTGEYYYHYFFPEQPDLNWRNPALREAMWSVVRFWLDLGVDGFRLDALGALFEDPDLRDTAPDRGVAAQRVAWLTARTDAERAVIEVRERRRFRYQLDLPEVHGLLRELRTLVDSYDDRVLVGETSDPAYHGTANDQLHLVFNFALTRASRLTPEWIRTNQAERGRALPAGAWPCNTLGNHDEPRIASRFRDDAGRASTRFAAALMLTLRGTPFLYYGEEIGMEDLPIEDASALRDRQAAWLYEAALDELQLPRSEALDLAVRYGRDKERTPMQWSASGNAGFCPADVDPWLPVHPNHAHGVNVADEVNDPPSLLEFYRRLLRVRRETPALQTGSYTSLHPEARQYLAFLRGASKGGRPCLVVLNASDQAHDLEFDVDGSTLACIFSSRSRAGALDRPRKLRLEPYEIYVGALR